MLLEEIALWSAAPIRPIPSLLFLPIAQPLMLVRHPPTTSPTSLPCDESLRSVQSLPSTRMPNPTPLPTTELDERLPPLPSRRMPAGPTTDMLVSEQPLP